MGKKLLIWRDISIKGREEKALKDYVKSPFDT